MLNGDTVRLLAGPEYPGQYAQVGSPTAASPIGKVERAEGTTSVQHADGTTGSLSVGDPIFEKDVVETEGSLGIRFDDGTVFSMSAGTRMVINHLVYDPNGSSNSALFSVLKGTFAMFGGKIVDTGDMKVATPIATLGIRGSNLIAVAVNTHEGWIGTNAVDPNGTPSEIEVLHQAHPGIYEVIGRLTDLFSVVAYTSTGEAVVLPSTPEQRALAEHLFDTLKQFYELHPELQPQSAPEFLTPDFFQKIDFGPTGVPTELLLQQALVIPSSVLAQLEEVGAQDFSLQTPTPQQVLLQQVLTLLQPPPVPPAIIPNSPPVITVELAGAAPTADTASASLTETDAGLQTTGTLTVTDANLFDVVTASVTGVTLGGTTGPLLPGDVQGFLTVTGGPIAADPGATNNLAWAFNSGTQAFDFLAAGGDSDADLCGDGDRRQFDGRAVYHHHHHRHQ